MVDSTGLVAPGRSPVAEPRSSWNQSSSIGPTVTMHDGAAPALTTLEPRAAARCAVLIAHGGHSRSTRPGSPLQPPALRMYPFLWALHRAGSRSGLLACQLRYGVRGYNDGDPVRDLEWALGELRRRHGALPVCLVGHSMGARSVLRAAGDADVRAVVALAPWLPGGEPVDQLAGRTVVIAHGTRDRVTSPASSLVYALRAHPVCARLCRFEVEGSRHALLDRFRLWQRLVRISVLASLGLGTWDGEILRGFALPREAACRMPL
jgi:pimeloyl-ACP methyl ester carboxylesterase